MHFGWEWLDFLKILQWDTSSGCLFHKLCSNSKYCGYLFRCRRPFVDWVSMSHSVASFDLIVKVYPQQSERRILIVPIKCVGFLLLNADCFSATKRAQFWVQGGRQSRKGGTPRKIANTGIRSKGAIAKGSSGNASIIFAGSQGWMVDHARLLWLLILSVLPVFYRDFYEFQKL